MTTATWTPAIAWEAFQYSANWSGEVCTWNCVLVHAASGTGTRPYSIKAEVLPFSLQSVDDTTIGNAGEVTLQVDGAKFDTATLFQLVNAAGDTDRRRTERTTTA